MEIVYWGEKTKRFIISLENDVKSRVIEIVDILKELGHEIDMPDSKSLGKGLFELRTQGKVKVRILYIFHNNKAYIIHGFVKKVWKISVSDIRYARNIQKEITRLV